MVKKAASTMVKTVPETTPALSHIKVCMHVVRTSRTEARVMRDASALVQAGCEVTIVDVEDNDDYPYEEKIDGIRIQHIFMSNWFSCRGSEFLFFIKAIKFFICSLYRLFKARADIYHASELTALPASFITAALRRKPIIFEAHELYIDKPETSLAFWRPLGGLLIRLLSLILPRCQGVISVSPPIIKEIQNRYHVPEVTLLRNVPTYAVVPKSDRLRQHLGLDAKMRIALYQGGLQLNRGLDKLICAAAFLDPDITIVLMGKYTGSTQQELETLLENEGAGDRVKILPPVPYRELLTWTVSADLGLVVLPLDYSLSIRWCLPNKLFEYMMVGLPILASPLEAVTEVITNYDVGRIVSSLTPEDIGAAINTMLADDTALAQMSRNALEAARNEFNWDKESRQLIKLYCDVLAKKSLNKKDR